MVLPPVAAMPTAAGIFRAAIPSRSVMSTVVTAAPDFTADTAAAPTAWLNTRRLISAIVIPQADYRTVCPVPGASSAVRYNRNSAPHPVCGERPDRAGFD